MHLESLTIRRKQSIKQIGIEIFFLKNESKDDKEVLDTSIKMLKASGFKKAKINIGNFKLFGNSDKKTTNCSPLAV